MNGGRIASRTMPSLGWGTLDPDQASRVCDCLGAEAGIIARYSHGLPDRIGDPNIAIAYANDSDRNLLAQKPVRNLAAPRGDLSQRHIGHDGPENHHIAEAGSREGL